MSGHSSDHAWLTARPIAHRGLHGLEPGVVENLPGAFAAAIDGRYAIECDIQISADGEAMVFHDFTLERLTEGSGRVDAHSAAALKALAFKTSPDRMLTLPELFALVAGRVPLIVEIKSEFGGRLDLTRRAAALASAYAGPVALMSFDPAPIAWLKQNAPGLVRGIVAESHYEDASWDFLPPATRQGLADLSHHADTDPHFLSWRVADLPNAATERYRGPLGRPVICWTVRTAADRAIAARHADQVTFEGYRA